MGVINNLIEIRRKFRAIVGANWDGITIDDIVGDRPKIAILTQPIDTNQNSVQIAINSNGFRYNLQVKDGSVWRTLGSMVASIYNDTTVNLSAVTETAICRINIWPYGAYVKLITNEFTVTRTEAQTASLKAGSASKGADIFTESEVDSIDVVKENIEKE